LLNVARNDSSLFIDIVRGALTRLHAEDWAVEVGDFWCSVAPSGHRPREQGWKLHLSATQLSGAVALSQTAEVLVRAGCAFKFARGLEQLGALLSNRCERGKGGKFITAYPADDDQFARLADELDRATDGLPGPAILSDHRLRPDSLVHYRYGVFEAEPVLTDHGTFESMLTGPDGKKYKDQRLAWFNPPPWSIPPLKPQSSSPKPPGPAAKAPERGRGQRAVLIGDRFEVREAIRHSYRGGVYLATDRKSGAEVVVKQARPHVMGSLSGADARDILRHEAQVLDLLSPLGLAPRRLALVAQQENLFLVEELIPGVTLRQWVAQRTTGVWRGSGPPLADAVRMAVQLVDILAAVHRQDLMLCDLNPNNVMVTPPDGQLRLVDLEFTVRTGSRVPKAFTLGYVGPERQAGAWLGSAPSRQSDLFSLGATIGFLISGLDLAIPAQGSPDPTDHERLVDLVSLMGIRMAAVRQLAPLVVGLMQDDPDERWSVAQAKDFLTAVGTAPDASAGPRPDNAADGTSNQLPTATADRLLADGLSYLLRTMNPDGPVLWKPGIGAEATDRCNVQGGAAGVLGVLSRAALVLGGGAFAAATATVANWIDRRLLDIPRLLPGLYFGRSGTAWAVHDAARLLADDDMAAHAVELAKRLPVQWPNPDVCHGVAGAGLAHLHLWASTGDPELERRSVEYADRALAAASIHAGHLVWPIPEQFGSDLAAGRVRYGFAHGVAGVGAFLLYCGAATGREEYLYAARQAGETLRHTADVEGSAAWWPHGDDGDPASARERHWCNGSSGVGTFLIRLWSVTGDQRFRDLAEAAAIAIHRDMWYSTTAACHGLAGDGDFLLDLARFTGDMRYREWAAELAQVMYARHTVRDGLLLLPDDSWTNVTAGYSGGLSGALGFLLRLRYGGPRWWMPDELLPDGGPWAPQRPSTDHLTAASC
jgi:rhamnogalacturonyl hydrolase YesR